MPRRLTRAASGQATREATREATTLAEVEAKVAEAGSLLEDGEVRQAVSILQRAFDISEALTRPCTSDKVPQQQAASKTSCISAGKLACAMVRLRLAEIHSMLEQHREAIEEMRIAILETDQAWQALLVTAAAGGEARQLTEDSVPAVALSTLLNNPPAFLERVVEVSVEARCSAAAELPAALASSAPQQASVGKLLQEATMLSRHLLPSEHPGRRQAEEALALWQADAKEMEALEEGSEITAPEITALETTALETTVLESASPGTGAMRRTLTDVDFQTRDPLCKTTSLPSDVRRLEKIRPESRQSTDGRPLSRLTERSGQVSSGGDTVGSLPDVDKIFPAGRRRQTTTNASASTGALIRKTAQRQTTMNTGALHREKSIDMLSEGSTSSSTSVVARRRACRRTSAPAFVHYKEEISAPSSAAEESLPELDQAQSRGARSPGSPEGLRAGIESGLQKMPERSLDKPDSRSSSSWNGECPPGDVFASSFWGRDEAGLPKLLPGPSKSRGSDQASEAGTGRPRRKKRGSFGEKAPEGNDRPTGSMAPRPNSSSDPFKDFLASSDDPTKFSIKRIAMASEDGMRRLSKKIKEEGIRFRNGFMKEIPEDVLFDDRTLFCSWGIHATKIGERKMDQWKKVYGWPDKNPKAPVRGDLFKYYKVDFSGSEPDLHSLRRLLEESHRKEEPKVEIHAKKRNTLNTVADDFRKALSGFRA